MSPDHTNTATASARRFPGASRLSAGVPGLRPALLIVCLGFAASWPLGCESEPAPGAAGLTASAPALPELRLDTPEDAARSALQTLLIQRAARARHDESAVEACRARLRQIAARAVILDRYRAVAHGRDVKPDAVIDTFTQGWGPIIGYYADGLKLDRLRVAGSAAGSLVNVYVPATSDRGEVTIRLECARDARGHWGVARIDFAAGSGRAPTASAPAP